MALTWNVENVKDNDSICFIPTGETDEDGKALRRMNPVTHALIFATMSVGMGRITEGNAPEFYARLNIMERLHGDMIHRAEGFEGDPKITPQEVRAHIGLYCNVGFETREEWTRRMFIGAGDGLTDYGDRLMTDDEIEAEHDRIERKANDLYEDGRYEEADRLMESITRYDVSVTSEFARHFRQDVKKAVA